MTHIKKEAEGVWVAIFDTSVRGFFSSCTPRITTRLFLRNSVYFVLSNLRNFNFGISQKFSPFELFFILRHPILRYRKNIAYTCSKTLPKSFSTTLPADVDYTQTVGLFQISLPLWITWNMPKVAYFSGWNYFEDALYTMSIVIYIDLFGVLAMENRHRQR